MRNLLVRKSIADLKAEERADAKAGGAALKRTLSVWSLVALGIGCIIGAGIFVLTGNAAASNAGPAVALSFIISAVVCAFAGLCYAEMASTVPISGSAYTYAYATLGELIAWIIGWDLILEYAFGATAVAIGWSGYVVSFLRDVGLPVSDRFAGAPFHFDAATGAWSHTGAIINLPAMLIIAAISGLLVLGTRESASLNNVIVVLKVAIVLIFIVAGMLCRHQQLDHGSQSQRLFHPAEPGSRHFRMERGAARRGGGVLRLYRLRCCFHRGARSQEPAARHADRNLGLAGDLHPALRAGELRHHRHRAL
jgi:APA family basic amino acid/polyamine antiporter